MHILFSSTRGTGHLRPLFPYLDAFIRRGHDVRVAAPESAAAILGEADYEHTMFGHPGDERLKPIWSRLGQLPHDEMVAGLIGEIFADMNPRAALPKLRETILKWHPDLIVRESLECAAAIAAAEAGVPHVRVAVNNLFMENRFIDHASTGIDALWHEAGLGSQGGAALRQEATYTMFPASLDGDAQRDHSPPPMRVRAERAVLDPNKPTPDWAPEEGEPFLFVTLGSVAGGSPASQNLIRASLDAISSLPVRALLSTGPVLDVGVLGTIPDNVSVEAWVEPAEIYPRATAILFHGGSGTLIASLAQGLPMVIAPLMADQPDNARRLAATGAGLAVFEQDVPSLRAGLQTVLEDPVIRECAKAVAAEMAQSHSVDAAVDAMLSSVPQ